MIDDKELFDALLDWLDPDREKAGQRYEQIRTGLVRMFISNGLSDAGHYSDVTIDRVIKRLPEIRADYVGDPAKYQGHWPGGGTSRPRSATIVITRKDGGTIGV